MRAGPVSECACPPIEDFHLYVWYGKALPSTPFKIGAEQVPMLALVRAITLLTPPFRQVEWRVGLGCYIPNYSHLSPLILERQGTVQMQRRVQLPKGSTSVVQEKIYR